MSAEPLLDPLRALGREGNKVGLPTYDGHIARQCPDCENLFSVAVEAAHPEEMVCPYCGVRRPVELYVTPLQKRIVREIMACTVSTSAAIPGGRPNRISDESSALAATERVDARLTCGWCGYEFGVAGSASHCPACADGSFDELPARDDVV